MSLRPPTQGTPSTATFESRIARIERGLLVNVDTHGAVADYDGTTGTDNLAAIQAAITAAGILGTGIYLNGRYKIAGSLTVTLYYGFRIVGADWETSVIEQATNDTPILVFTADNTHSVKIENVRLRYITQQTTASHPNSYAIELRPGLSSFNGFYHWHLTNVKFSGATVGFGINNAQSAGFQIPGWGMEFDTVLWERMGSSAVRIKSPVSVGSPCLAFTNCKVFQSGVVNTDECFSVRGEVCVSNLDVEDWYNRVWESDSGAGGSTFTQVHVEHHHVTEAGTRMFSLLNANWSVRGLSVGFDTITTFGPHRILAWSSGYHVDVDAVELATAATVTVSNETNLVYTGGTGPQQGRVGAVSIAKAGTGTLQIVRNTDVGPAMLTMVNGRPVVTSQTVSTDVAFTLTPGTSPESTKHTGTLTANRAVTLSTTGAITGERFVITRTGSGAFTLDIGTGPLKSLSTGQWGEFTYDGSAWYLSRFGSL